jgi:hypothetical protein
MRTLLLIVVVGWLAAGCRSSKLPSAPARLAADTPAAVSATVLAVLGADVPIEPDGAEADRTYEAATRTKLDLELDGSGALIKTEIALPVASLPAAVATTASKRGTIVEAEVVVTAGSVAFEVEVRAADGNHELLIDVSGAELSADTDHDVGDNDDDIGDDDDE